MAVETLKIVLTADNKEAIAGMNETVNSLNKVNAAGAATGQAVTKMGTNFTGLSRVIQDLPYGFNAISNNLTQLLPAAGAAGLAFSALVAGLTILQTGWGAWTRGLDKLTGSVELAEKVNQEYVKSLAEEKVKLDSLFKVAEDNNLSLKVRQEAVIKLRDSYGAYLKGYTDEEILVGKAAKAHDALTEAIKQQSIAEAAKALAAPIQQKILENEIKLLKLKESAIIGVSEAGKGGVETISAGPGVASVRITAQQRQQGVLNQYMREATAIMQEQAKSQKELNYLYDIAAKNATISNKLSKEDSKTKAESKKKEVS